MTEYKIPEFKVRWYHHTKSYNFIMSWFYHLQFNLYTVHTKEFKQWAAMHDRINKELHGR
jgi:hypothetical protein